MKIEVLYTYIDDDDDPPTGRLNVKICWVPCGRRTRHTIDTLIFLATIRAIFEQAKVLSSWRPTIRPLANNIKSPTRFVVDQPPADDAKNETLAVLG